jgi:IS30 family transposase
VERTTGYLALVHLREGREAAKVARAMTKTVRRVPSELVRSITWDQGREMAHHARFSVATGVAVYFCDPQSPWQRPTNENTNGLLRQYLPKGMDLSDLTRADLDAIAQSLNDRPRKRLGYMKPSERFAEFFASTD